ncbi:MAG: SdrD B-like domain-containing protein [Planctomycetota bacterium]
MVTKRAVGAAIAGVTLATAGLTSTTFADTETEGPQVMNYSEVPGVGFMLDLTFDRFDEMGGARQLTSVAITSEAQGQIDVSIENNGVNPATMAFTTVLLAQSLTVPQPPDPPIMLNINVSDETMVPPLAGSDGNPLMGDDFVDLGTLSVAGVAPPVTLNLGADDLTNFIVDGLDTTFDAQVTAGITVSAGSASFLALLQNPLVTGEVTVTYTFCLVPGACCLPDGTCVEVLDTECDAQGGVFQGFSTLCADVEPCPQAMLGDFVFEDSNGNGVQDPGEPGIPGVTVKLLDDMMMQIDTDVTGAAGDYLFTGLAMGTYTVMIDDTTLPAGYLPTAANVGGDDTIDSDFVGGMVTVFLPANDTVNLTVDAGFIPQGQIGDCIWEDIDGDGIKDPGEPGIPGVTVTLCDAGAVEIGMVVTGATGDYLFTQLPAGDYTVKIDPLTVPPGFTESPPNQGGDDTVDSDCVAGVIAVTLATPATVDLTNDCGFVPPGACCILGQLCQVLSQDDCNAMGGDYQGNDTTCPEVNCPERCCFIDGTCADLPAPDCLAASGVPGGPATQCAGFVCPLFNGACCLMDGSCVVTVDASACVMQGGVFQGIGTTCAPNPCPEACCFPDGMCQLLTITACGAAGGTSQGAGTNCAPNLCPMPGACCLPDGMCVIAADAAACTGLGGLFEGPGTVCAPNPCPAPGACCLPDGTCIVVLEIACNAAGGDFQGDGTACAPNPCPEACCFANGACLNLAPATCALQGGVSQGVGTNCTPNLCPQPPDDGGRGNCNQKGSFLIFSKVEVRWDMAGNLLQDTFIHLTNDFPDDVQVQMYFINGDPPLDATIDERAHPGWNWVDNLIELTADQPVYWSAATGQPLGVSPFGSALDPGFPPGRPCPDNPAERCIRGFIVAWAVNASNDQIRWDHLAGEATLVNYANNYAWSYTACGYQVVSAVAHGAPVGVSGCINLDGIEYEAVYDLLLLEFVADGSAAYANAANALTSGDLTLHPVSADLRQETDGPVTVKASFEVWNQNEFKFSGLDRCISCWDQTLFRDYTDDGPSNHLLLDNLQTNVGKARIDGLASQICDVDFDPSNNDTFPFPPGPGDTVDPRDVVSQAAALTGVRAHFITFGAALAPNGAAGGNLVGMGQQSAKVQFDTVGLPPTTPTVPRTPAKTSPANTSFDGLVESLFSPAGSGR